MGIAWRLPLSLDEMGGGTDHMPNDNARHLELMRQTNKREDRCSTSRDKKV